MPPIQGVCEREDTPRVAEFHSEGGDSRLPVIAEGRVFDLASTADGR
jgi:hypothetical protein